MFNLNLLNQSKKINEIFMNLNHKAYEMGVCQRSSKINPTELMKCMIYTHLHYRKPSLDNYSLSYEMLFGKHISRQSINQRINEDMINFQKSFLISLMSLFTGRDDNIPKLLKSFSKVYVVDSTIIKLNDKLVDDFKSFRSHGKGKSALKLSIIYDPIDTCVNGIGVHGALLPDSKFILDINFERGGFEKGSLFLYDLGYISSTLMNKLTDNGYYFVSKMKTGTRIYKKNTKGRKKWIEIDLLKTLYKIKEKAIYDTEVYVTGKKIPVRLIIIPFSKELVKERLRRKKLEYRNRGGVFLSKRVKRMMNYAVLITNADKDLISTRDIYNIYAVRWKVELLFKTMKSRLNVKYLCGYRKDRVLFELYGKLITLILITLFNNGFYFLKSSETFIEISLDKSIGLFRLSSFNILLSIGHYKSFIHNWLFYIRLLSNRSIIHIYRNRGSTLNVLNKHMKGGYKICSRLYPLTIVNK